MEDGFETPKDAYFSELIKNSYGSSEELARHLDLGIEMLFYIEEDTFHRKDLQDVVAALRGIVLALRKGK
ncbi:hypothetical protein [Spongiimicrobium sp. 3-5]|uniref:hypothetical protein n=1 Tax=Spongiimicrobium sp. 3-5 TaxID=3332596 RepID=UPI003980B0D9